MKPNFLGLRRRDFKYQKNVVLRFHAMHRLNTMFDNSLKRIKLKKKAEATLFKTEAISP